jgi:hypothetical protein
MNATIIPPNRNGVMIKMNWNTPTNTGEVIAYRPDGRLFDLKILPPLDAVGVPDVAVRMECIKDAPERFPGQEGFRCRFEHEGELFHFFGFSIVGVYLPPMPGSEPEFSQTYNTQCQSFAIVTNAAGKVVHTVTGPFFDFSYPDILFQHARNTMIFEKYKKPCEMKQAILPVDEESLTHHFKVEFSGTGFGRHTFTGNVTELRRRGFLKLNRSFFDKAEIWPIKGVPVLVAVLHDGTFYAAPMSKQGTTHGRKFPTYDSVLRGAQELAENPEPPAPPAPKPERVKFEVGAMHEVSHPK